MVTPYHLVHVDDMEVAQFDDAHHRGPNWYDYSMRSKEDASTLETDESSSLVFSSYDKSEAEADKTSLSSEDTTESKLATKMYRACTPCPKDMLKKHSNIGIKWICAAYQRARRSFKSDCMMRYRNCQDGTMFVKLHERKCKNDSYHGKHWFYEYQV
ncbi:uncharacterized protein LOC113501811 [Trichoplusia ni]|uniref:Uncharacterized protein LOC113501811 n=1 Tax=Trichoplusia ni TaxID=7111 RepID=A0A7E5WDX9_TRINI|nr:uncharacterized protein LOC113501811 [Trichoplusia ni]